MVQKNRLYNKWCSMKSQSNPATKSYKGVELCEEWLIFDNFQKWALENGWEESKWITRMDSDKGFNPLNCVIVNKEEATKLSHEKIKKKCQKLYGCDWFTQTAEAQEKRRKTCIEKYGVDNSAKSKVVQDKKKKTMMEKYGVENSMQYEGSKEKFKQTCLERFGVEYPSQSEEIKKKKEATFIKHYGVKYGVMSEEVKAKIRATCIKKYGVISTLQDEATKEKIKQTLLKKYGTVYVTQNQEIKDKIIKTNLEKYGVEHVSQCKEIRDRIINTVLERYGTLFPKVNLKTEKKIKEWLNSFGFDFKENWNILDRQQIDFFDENLQLAIEYCGLYWHMEDSPEPRNRTYHYSKYKKCLDKNIRLITIFSDEWKTRNKQVKNYLKSVFGKNENLIYARDCSIHQVNKETGQKFINENHIQEIKRVALVYFGLFYKDILVGIASLNNHHRNSSELVLDRLCFLENYNITGGASKLFSRCVTWAKEKCFNKIISWSDNRWSNGKVYDKLGFIMEKELKPDYSYVLISNPNKRIPKQSMRKKKIGCPIDKTEKEFMLEQGYSRIWDCGKKRFIYNIQ